MILYKLTKLLAKTSFEADSSSVEETALFYIFVYQRSTLCRSRIKSRM